MSGVCQFLYHAAVGCWSDRAAKGGKPSIRTLHTTSVRGNLVKTYKTDINEDYVVDAEQELGKGGCGVVVVGEHRELRTQYAIKIVDKSHAERGRLDRELKLLKDVDHTNVVRLFSVYDVPTHMYFVMELCLGGHLGNLLARQPKKYLDETWAKQLALQLLSAVAHIHSRGIAHRDIKLQNILVDQNTNDRTAQLKLIDFGYGSRFIGALPMRTKCGTPYTTAPEVIREHYDERCDVWSTGVVLYIMLCGRRPFEALNCAGTLADAGKAAMITNILAGRYHFNHKAWQTVSKQGQNFVKALLHPDYKLRMHSHEALLSPWLVDTAIINTHANVLSSQKSFLAANNIRRMSDVSELHRTGMVALVFGVNNSTVSDMSAVFQSFDSDASGMISKEEFARAMQKIVPELTVADLNKLFDIIDYDNNGLISYTEFLAATLDPRELDIGELNKAFRLFDEDGNGYIDREEMRKVIKMQCEQALANNHNSAASVGSPRSVGAELTDAELLAAEVDAKVNRIFSEADVNNDGAISHAEFLWVMTGLDFHKLERVGVPPEGGSVSAKDTFIYNSKLNNSYDSAEDWNTDIDQPFKVEQGYSMKESGPAGSSKKNTSLARSMYPSSSSGIAMTTTGSTKSAKSSRSGSKSVSPMRGGARENTASAGALLDTHLEKNLGESSSSGKQEEEAERPVQRLSRRQRDEPMVERVDTPVFKGVLGMNAAAQADDVVYGERVIPSPISTPGKSYVQSGTLAIYQDLPAMGMRSPSDDDADMEVAAEQYGSRKMKPVPTLALSRGNSGKFGLAGSAANSQRASVKFEQLSTNIYKSELEEEKDEVPGSNRSSMKDLRGFLSRQPSYRESTILDSAGGGKDTIRVLVSKPSPRDIPSVSSTRQNSGEMAVMPSSVDAAEPVPPFLSRAGSQRVFSLSNMLRTNDYSTADPSGKITGGAYNDAPPPLNLVPTSPPVFSISRGTSMKSIKM